MVTLTQPEHHLNLKRGDEMKNEKTIDLYACDFETTVYSGQDHTEVWSSAICKIGTEDEAIVHHSIEETMEYWNSIGNDVIG